MKPDDRIAISGKNGAGKTLLLEHVLNQMTTPLDKIVLMPQEISAAAASELLDQARSLQGDQLGHLMTVVSRLGSRPDRLLQSPQPSPGEIRKLLLAMGMARSPHLIVLDEPTNHLDLPSIEALETALAECPCALLIVSHDERFVDALATLRWQIDVDDQGNSALSLSACSINQRYT
jgi:macrolide transport system ATP-binding/permease protein